MDSVANSPRASASPRAGEAAFRELYKELIEINTTLSVGSCTAAAEAMSARLKAAGLPAADIQILVPPDRPKDGNLIAMLRGQDRQAKALLLLAHVDVVEAKREDWVRDPFKLVEEDGWFYARGASDDKAMAAVFTDSLIRYQKEGFKPRRDIKLALTCGEESPDTFNGVEWLMKNHPEALRRRVRHQRGRRRRARRRRQAGHAAGPGRREGLPGLHARSDQRRRAQLAAGEGQRHLSPGRRAVANLGVDNFRSVSTGSRAPTSRRRPKLGPHPPPTFARC